MVTANRRFDKGGFINTSTVIALTPRRSNKNICRSTSAAFTAAPTRSRASDLRARCAPRTRTRNSIGVEYSSRSSGLHFSDFDDLLLQRPWEELDLDTYARTIKELLDSGAYWLSGVDLEIMWLASVFSEGHPNLLSPPRAAVRRMAKPAVEAHRGLPVKIPPFICAAEHSDWDLHAFCRKYDWKVWLKGPYYEAVRTGTWDAVETARTAIKRAWSTDNVFVQAHVTGYEESVCFSAYRGELLASAYMRKREITPEGKTWAGDISDVPEEFSESAAPDREGAQLDRRRGAGDDARHQRPAVADRMQSAFSGMGARLDYRRTQPCCGAG